MKAASTDHNQANNQKQPSENSVREGVLRKILTTLFIELTDKYYFAQIGLKLEKRIEITLKVLLDMLQYTTINPIDIN